jgi:hypothetical protein
LVSDPVALERAAQLAARAGQDMAERITWEQADVLSLGPRDHHPRCDTLRRSSRTMTAAEPVKLAMR